ncbi:hypothetical protein FO519_001302 [Halicephalobus sp. NKZ332]|nr:hypothetical protein FO519_001302 [Halicephalobus sp. NKZ332]
MVYNLAGATFVYHVFEKEQNIRGSKIDEEKSVVQKQVNLHLVRWLSLEEERKRLIKSVINDTANPDIAFARAWAYISKNKLFGFEKSTVDKVVEGNIEEINGNQTEYYIFEEVKEINEFFEVAEKKGLLENYLGEYGTREEKDYSENEKKKKLLEIALSQECTNSVFLSIKNFMDFLNFSKGKILIGCNLMKNNLILPMRIVVNEIKEPFLLLMKNEKIRFIPEEVEDILDQLEITIENLLRIEDVQNIPEVVQFSKLIRNEKIDSVANEEEIIKILKECRRNILKLEYCPKIIEFNVFCIDFETVWQQLKDRAQKKILECFHRLRSDFHEKLLELQQKFNQFKKILSFRSMESSLMLLNKASVIQICNEDIPEAVNNLNELYSKMEHLSQFLIFDSEDHELLISLVSMRRALPRQISDHRMFFQRRMNVFSNFVKNRQAIVQEKYKQCLDELKILNNFTNPGEAEAYLEEIKELQPGVQDLTKELSELNQYEKVVNFPVTKIPMIEMMEKNMRNLTKLFEWTDSFNKKQENFLKQSRTNANVGLFLEFVEEFLVIISDMSVELESQKSTRHFIVQLRTEIERSKQSLPVIDVLSCNRLREWHWQKMSDIVGFDLSQFKDATVAQISELGINQHVSRLKPITYIAERQGIISDQTNHIMDHWMKAIFEIQESTFWNIPLPENLDQLLEDANLHFQKLSASYEPEDEESPHFQEITKWIMDIKSLISILTKWRNSLVPWKSISEIMRHSYNLMPREFSEFRMCAKYWSRFGEQIKSDPRVLKILNEKHVKCWLRLVGGHLQKLIMGCRSYFSSIRQSNGRLSMISDSDMLKLLSDISPTESFEILRRTCFPLLKEISLNHKKQICIVNVENEFLSFGNILTLESLRKEGPFHFVSHLTEAINGKIIEDFKKNLEQDPSKAIFQISKMLVENTQGGMQDSVFKYSMQEGTLKLRLKNSDKEVFIEADFVPVFLNLPPLNFLLANNWAYGKVPILVGNRADCRQVIRRMAQNLCTPVHFINSHKLLQLDVIHRCIKAARQNSFLFVIEHIDQLSEKLLIVLFETVIDIINCLYPRLVLCTTLELRDEKILKTPNIYIEHVSSFEMEKSSHRLAVSPSVPGSLKVSSATSERRSSINRRKSTSKQTTLADILINTVSGEKNSNFDIAVLGCLAKDGISQMIKSMNIKVTWIYFDAFLMEQLVSRGSSFGRPPEGHLIFSLKNFLKESENEEEESSKFTESNPKVGRFIIFYGHHTFELQFSFLSSLFSTVNYRNWPPSFLTLHDGSNFSISDVHFIFCNPNSEENIIEALDRYSIETIILESKVTPSPKEVWQSIKKKFGDLLEKTEFSTVVTNSVEIILLQTIENLHFQKQMNFDIMFDLVLEDLKEVLPNVFLANCGEVLRWTTCSTGLNFLIVYCNETPENFDVVVEHQVEIADRHILDGGKLPKNISQFKLSEFDFNKWIKWSEEVHFPSYISKELSLSNIYVTVPQVDRILTFAENQFLKFNNNLVVFGQPFSGKTAFVKRFIQYISTVTEQFVFSWLTSFDRFNLQKMQKIFWDILRTSDENKTTVLVIDQFQFSEPICALLELFVDQKKVIQNGIPQDYPRELRLILIMNENDADKCYERKTFIKKFTYIPLKIPTKEELKMIMEQLLTTHLQSQNFSSDYITVTSGISSATMKLLNIVGMQPKNNEGISYSLILDIEEFKDTLENLHFEFSKNHENWHINVAITDYVASHCQRIMRVLRQVGEHLALTGKPGIGRYQILKLSTFAVVGTIRHVFVNTQSEEAFEESWKRVMKQSVMLIAMSNQPVNIIFHFDHVMRSIPLHALVSLKQWLQNPRLDGLLEDDVILKHGEKIIDCERTLATLVQSSNIRLPGQRYCQFVSMEALKDIDQLKSLLSSRIQDFLHGIFLIPPESLPLFEWCSADCFLPLTADEGMEMGKKILSDCIFSNKSQLLSVLQQVYEIAELTKQSKNFFSNLFPPSKLWFMLCQQVVSKYNLRMNLVSEKINILSTAIKTISRIRQLGNSMENVSIKELKSELDDVDLTLLMQRRHFNEDSNDLEEVKDKIKLIEEKCNSIEVDILQKQAAVDAVMDKPLKDFQLLTEKISEFSFDDFKKLASMSKPNMAVKYSVEALRRTLEDFQPKKTGLENWTILQNFLTQRNLIHKIKVFNPYDMDPKKISYLSKYTERKEMRIAKLESDVSLRLPATICNWVSSTISLAEVSSKLSKERTEVSSLWSKLHEDRETLIKLRKNKQGLELTVEALRENIAKLEEEMMKIRKVINYRQRGSKIVEELGNLEPRWMEMIQIVKNMSSNLLGNTILDAGFQSLLLSESTENRQSICTKWGTTLLRSSISFEQRYCTVENLILNKMRETTWDEPFSFIFDKTNTFVDILTTVMKATVIEIPSAGWTDPQFVAEFQRAFQLDSVVVINNVVSEPPLEFFKIFLREPENDEDTIEVGNRSCHIRKNRGFILVTTENLDVFSTQFMELVTPVIIHDKIMKAEDLGALDSLDKDEDIVARTLSEYAAVDILDSQETTDQLLLNAETLMTKLEKQT